MNFNVYTHKARLGYSPCDYAFLVDRSNYTFHTADLKMDINTTMPVWLDWAIRDNLTCDEAKKAAESYACVTPNSECRDSSNGLGYVCNCSMGYEGNPYIANGCTGKCVQSCTLFLFYLISKKVAVFSLNEGKF
jgi:hypothetical protein